MSEQHTEAGEEAETATDAEETEEGTEVDAETASEGDGQTRIV